MISGTTTLIAHMGFPTYTFKSPLIYNPWFDKNGVDAVVVPMGVKAEDYPDFFRSVFRLTNIRGALITMPHKVTTMELVDEISPVAEVAGSDERGIAARGRVVVRRPVRWCGFRPRASLRKGFQARPASGRWSSGNGGVGSPIAASLAGITVLSRDRHCSTRTRRRRRLSPQRIRQALPGRGGRRRLEGSRRVSNLIVNATPIGMKEGNQLPVDVQTGSHPRSFVGDVVLKAEVTPFLQAAQGQGLHDPGRQATCCSRMIPAYLEFFGFGTATADELRATGGQIAEEPDASESGDGSSLWVSARSCSSPDWSSCIDGGEVLRRLRLVHHGGSARCRSRSTS